MLIESGADERNPNPLLALWSPCRYVSPARPCITNANKKYREALEFYQEAIRFPQANGAPPSNRVSSQVRNA
jgi:hypothetical protein